MALSCIKHEVLPSIINSHIVQVQGHQCLADELLNWSYQKFWNEVEQKKCNSLFQHDLKKRTIHLHIRLQLVWNII